jgi:hypothetical protein
MAQYAVLIYDVDSAHSPGATADTSPEVATCDEHAQGLASTAVMTAAWAFTPRSMATSVRAHGITPGPFHDSREVVAGLYILEAPDLDTALATVSTNPVLRQGGGLEVRPVHSGGLTGQSESAPATD